MPSASPRATPGLPDLLAQDLKVVFCGLNPGLAAATVGHHFEGRSNRFWRVLHLSGFTPTLLSPREDARLLEFGYGLTTAVARATAGAQDLSRQEFVAARSGLEAKIGRVQPRFIAFLGKAAYAAMTGQSRIGWGLQPETFGEALAWVLPNPSGLNRGFSLDALVAAYRDLRQAVDAAPLANPRTPRMESTPS